MGYLLAAVVLVGLVAIGGCDEGPQTFESEQVICKSVGDCHVKQMPYQPIPQENNIKNN